MAGVRGVVVGALTLVTIQTVVQPQAAGRVGGLANLAAGGARRFLDPSVPLLAGAPAPTQGTSPAPSPAATYPDPRQLPALSGPARAETTAGANSVVVPQHTTRLV